MSATIQENQTNNIVIDDEIEVSEPQKTKVMKHNNGEIKKVDSKAEAASVFTCGICLNWLKYPITLKCKHSYCRLCLLDVDKKCFRLSKENLNCPLCKKAIKESASTLLKIPEPLYFTYGLAHVVPMTKCHLCETEMLDIHINDEKVSCACLPFKCSYCRKKMPMRLKSTHETFCLANLKQHVQKYSETLEQTKILKDLISNAELKRLELIKQLKKDTAEMYRLKFSETPNIEKELKIYSEKTIRKAISEDQAKKLEEYLKTRKEETNH
jgi:hypothetical protein